MVFGGVKNKAFSFTSGLLGDTGTTAAVLVFVFIFTIILGIIYYFLLELLGGIFLLGGVIFSIVLIPIVIILGIVNYLFIKHFIEKKQYGILRIFKSREVKPQDFTSEYRKKFIIQKLVSFGISIVIFIIATIFAGIILLIPYFCLIFLPAAFPFIILSITMPAIAWLTLAYAFDPYEPEPRGFVIIALLWGMISTFPSLFMNTFNSTWMSDLGTGIVSAPIFEELFKSLGFFLIYRQIKDETDGLIYGIAFGAGFALLENFLYGMNTLIAGGGGIGFVLLIGFRSFFNIALHIVGPAAIGFMIGLHKSGIRNALTRKMGSRSALVVSTILMTISIVLTYLFAVGNHSLWNTFASLSDVLNNPKMIFVGILVLMAVGFFELICIVSAIIIAFFSATKRYNKRIDEYSWD